MIESALPRLVARRRGFAAARSAARVLWSDPQAPITLASVTRRLRFGHYLIDLAARELCEDGGRRQLSPKIFDCIAYLIEHRERAVGRDELMAAVWGRADTADSQLGQAMLKARRALGDSGETQHTIRTIAGFGYRWVADVHDEEASEAVGGDEAAPDADSSAANATWRVPRRWRLPAAAMLLLLALAGGFSALRGGQPSATPPRAGVPGLAAPAPTRAVATIAVLPAAVDAADEWSWLRLGVMEFVATRLRNAGQVVAPSENVVPIMRTATDAAALPEAVRRALEPRWLVVPDVRRTDHGWTVSLELRDRGDSTRAVATKADDPIAAARLASDRLLDLLGQGAPVDAEAAAWPHDELLSRIDAALLVDDLDTARGLLQAAPPRLRDAPDARLRVAEIEFARGQFESANADLERLLAAVPAETNPLLRARIQSARGAVLVSLARAAEAVSALDRAVALLENRGDPALLGKAFMRRGVAQSLLRDDDAAMADFAQARIAMQLAGDTLGLAQVDLNEGALNGTRNHPAAALEDFRRAERNFERFGVSSELVMVLGNQVVAHRALLQPDDALAASTRSLALLGKLASPMSEHLLKLRRAQALADAGHWTEAGALLDELARAVDPLAEAEMTAMVATERARLALARGHAEQAWALADPVAGQASAPEFSVTRSAAWFTAIRALHALGRYAEAGEAVGRYSAWSARTGNGTFAVPALLAEAEQALVEQRFADADRLHADSLRAANAQNVPAELAEVVRSHGEALIARGDLVRAVPVVGQVAQFAERDFGCAVLQARLFRALGQTESWRSALERARALAGERPLPADVAGPAPILR